VKSRLSARLMPNQNIRLVPQEQWDQPLHRKVLMKSIFLVLAMMACAGELRAQTHINQLQGIIQSGMQPSSVPGPGTGVAVGPTSHIAQLQGIIQTECNLARLNPEMWLWVPPNTSLTCRASFKTECNLTRFNPELVWDMELPAPAIPVTRYGKCKLRCGSLAIIMVNRRAIRFPFADRLAELSVQDQSACYRSSRPAVFESAGRPSEIAKQLASVQNKSWSRNTRL